MKKLLLALAFMLSIGVFAQDQTYPRDPNLQLCFYLYDVTPTCRIGTGVIYVFPGTYDVLVCGPESWIGSVKPADLEKMIQDYICEYNKFPDWAYPENYRPKWNL
ncbi:hypothetical protein [Myroides fluvii]|uniref:hypothetical protein n=1 Tax=Myroides fluvii TaxID=2572594 RepID=UPI00131AFBAD|nr:hypothetical protein [Myroides fluvii]